MFPPQARGWTISHLGAVLEIGVSPAGAGMDLRILERSGTLLGFPRRRGDGPDELTRYRQGSMFPPQARGWTLRGLAVEDAE